MCYYNRVSFFVKRRVRLPVGRQVLILAKGVRLPYALLKMISDILALYDFIDKKLAKASVLKAFFCWDGTRKSGNSEITIKLHGNPNQDKIWFYEVTQYKNFVFVPMPVNPAMNFDFGKTPNDKSPDSKYFRFVSSPVAKFAKDGEENIRVDFMIIGYIPDDLLDRQI